MTDQSITVFELSPVPTNPTKFHVRAKSGKDYGPATSIAAALSGIIDDYPLNEVINFQWDNSSCLSFENYTVEQWARSTAARRGVKKDEVEAHITTLQSEDARLNKKAIGAW